MSFNGEIIFSVSDEKNVSVDFGLDLMPTKIINKGNVIMGRTAPRYKWIYETKFDGENEYYECLEKLLNKLYMRKEYIHQLIKQYEEVGIIIYIRSELGQIGYSLPYNIIHKIEQIQCSINFDIISFGLAKDEK